MDYFTASLVKYVDSFLSVVAEVYYPFKIIYIHVCVSIYALNIFLNLTTIRI